MIDSVSHHSSGTDFYLELNEEGQPEVSPELVYSVEVNSIITLHLYNGSPIAYKVMLMSNVYQPFPSPWYLEDIKDGQLDLDKEKAYLKYPSASNTASVFVIQVNRPGVNTFSLAYYHEQDKKYKLTTPFNILAHPALVFGTRRISLNSIQLQTVLSKSLGKLSTFEAYFKECELLKYNMVHFTAFQELSSTDSLYSIKDQLQVSDCFFEERLCNEDKLHKLKDTISLLHSQDQIGGVVDIVLNHTSKESDFLSKHPECGFNLANSPWLTVAYEFDKLLVDYATKFYDKRVGCKSAPYINSEDDLNEAMAEIAKEVHRCNFEEFFLIPIERYYDEFKLFYLKNKDNKGNRPKNPCDRPIILDSEEKAETLLSEEELFDLIFNSCSNYGESRFGVKIQVEFVGMLLLEASKSKGQVNEFEFLRDIKKHINRINDEWTERVREMQGVGIKNLREFIKYQFITLKRAGVRRKLIDNYFIVIDPSDKGKIFACNGWVMESDETSEHFPNITKDGSWYYFMRKVIVWPDSIKLNYGLSEADSSFLIAHMSEYVKQMAAVFDGFVIDTMLAIPVYALQLLIHKAREVNPNLLVIGQLLHGQKELEAYYMDKVGINLFIQELTWCRSSEDIERQLLSNGKGSRLIRSSPEPSFFSLTASEVNEQAVIEAKYYTYLKPKRPEVILFDLTHDNETYHERFGNISLNLTIMACQSLSSSAVGSTRGFDQLFPFQPSVTKENRLYSFDDSFEDMLNLIRYQATQSEKKKEVFFEFHPRNSLNPSTQTVKLALSTNDWRPDIALTKINDNLFTAKVVLPKGKYHYKYVLDGNIWTHDPSQPMEKDDTGKNINNVLDLGDDTKLIVSDLKVLRHDLNSLRNDFNQKGSELFVHREKDLLAVIRLFRPEDIKKTIGYEGYTLISRLGYDSSKKGGLTSRVTIPGEIADFISGCYMMASEFEMPSLRSEAMLSGIKGNVYYTKDVKFLSSIANVSVVKGQTLIDFHSILPNTVILFKIKVSDKVKQAETQLNEKVKQMRERGHGMISRMSIEDINHVLFTTEEEEEERTIGKRKIYQINNGKPLVYAGLSHLHQMIANYKKGNDADNPVYINVEQSDGLMNYIMLRLKDCSSLKALNQFIDENIVKAYATLYPHLKPLYFTLMIEALYFSVLRVVFAQTPSSTINYGDFSQSLSIAAYQFLGGSSKETPSLMTKSIQAKAILIERLPHFGKSASLCSVRSALMAFKGIFLLQHLHDEAKAVIKEYGAAFKNGMIPNQWSNSGTPLYNGIDCPWLFILAIRDYISFTNDTGILFEEVELSCGKAKGEAKTMTISDIIQSIFQSHGSGIDFKESTEALTRDSTWIEVKIRLDPKTGFIYGVSEHKAGTWMNTTNSKGIPLTPRNGAAIELIALLYASLEFVIKMIDMNIYKHKSVQLNGVNYPFTQWRLLIRDNFEKSFHLSKKTQINREGIYKDYLTDDKDKRASYQLRPNFLIAMANALDLFDKPNALKALDNAEKYLIVPGSLGVCSLDIEDKDYLQNSTVAHVWLIGYYLQARLNFWPKDNQTDYLHYANKILIPLMKHIRNSPWMGLPERTSTAGKECDGYKTHIVSIALINEVIAKMSSIFE